MLYYKESTLFFGFYSGFTRGEYHIASVDFIVALRRTKGRGRRTLRSPPSPWNHACVVHWTPPHPPGGIRFGGAYLLPRVWGNLEIRYPVQVVYRQFRILCSFLCSGWYRSRFSRVAQLGSHVFHYWGEGSFVPAATWGFCYFFRRICADRDWIVSFGG